MTMLTKWGAALDRSCPLPEYPRPQLRRESFYNLNGVWDYAVTPSGDEPEVWDGEIVVPFSPEAPLSGAARGPAKDEYLHYRRGFTLPEGFQKSRVLLHFGAVDQIAEVFVNGVSAAKHSGGYWPFSADITSLLREEENILRVTVRDNADDPTFAYGKQRYKRGGMWYTAQSGIWQTVWLESVPEAYVKSLRITPEFDEARVRIELETALESSAAITCDVRAADGSFVAGSWAKGGVCVVPLPGFHAWTPDDPYLYTLDITCGEDRVESYFAMRKFSYVELGGHKVFGLNNAPRASHAALGRGDGERHRNHEALRLQHAAQAYKDRAAALVLSLRPARHDRMAGHGVRRAAVQLSPCFRSADARQGRSSGSGREALRPERGALPRALPA